LEDFVVTYLCCDKCGKCYELQQNESPEDFDNTCDCGEKLTVYKNLKDFYKNNHPDKPKKGKILFTTTYNSSYSNSISIDIKLG
jgi:hypothetical protein